jgi:Ion transport protein
MIKAELIGTVSENFDRVFTALFVLEALLKSVALGFCMDQGAYLKEGWSQMDFIIAIVSIIDSALANLNLPAIKVLRLLRTLRPLRFISHNKGMRTMVAALMHSLGGIFNVGIVVMIVWMMFAILAVNLFGGKLNYCTLNTYVYHTEE